MIGRGARIGGVVHCRRINLRHWRGDQLPGARDVGLAAGAPQLPSTAEGDALGTRRDFIAALRRTGNRVEPVERAPVPIATRDP